MGRVAEGNRNDWEIQSVSKLVLFHDFLTDVKDWMFHNLQLNLDKTRIIQGEEKLE